MSFETTSLREEHLGDAASLVIRRYKVLRERLPLLPSRYEEPDAIVALLGDLLAEAQGVIALRRGRLVGFLSGLVIPLLMGKRTVFSPDWANGAEPDDTRRVYEEMYSHLAEHWLADGCVNHVVSLLAHDGQGIEGWQWLGFGMVSVDAVRGLGTVPAGAADVEVRQAGVEDSEQVATLVQALERHLAAAPTFWIHELDNYGEWSRQPGNIAWLAFQRGEVAGYMALEPGDHCECEFLRDEKTVNIAGAFTKERARGKGVATALLSRSLAWAKAAGYLRCAVDFEAMNPLANRFWTRWFAPVSLSLMRNVDDRVVKTVA